MTDSTANVLSIIFGLGVFAVIMALGWRSVQKRRILRLQGADGQETIIIAGEADEISSIVTSTTETAQSAPAPAPSIDAADVSHRPQSQLLAPRLLGQENLVHDVDHAVGLVDVGDRDGGSTTSFVSHHHLAAG